MRFVFIQPKIRDTKGRVWINDKQTIINTDHVFCMRPDTVSEKEKFWFVECATGSSYRRFVVAYHDIEKILDSK